MGPRTAMQPVLPSRGRCWMSLGGTIYIFSALKELLRAALNVSTESALTMVDSRMFHVWNIEWKNLTSEYRCVLGEGCIGGCGCSWFLVGSLQCTVVWCKQFVDGLHDKICSSCWQSASLVEFSSQGYPSFWCRWNICFSQRRHTLQPCIAHYPAG